VHFRLFVRRPVAGGGRIAVERQPSRRVDIDEIIGDRRAPSVDQKVAFEIDAGKDDQITERQRQSDDPDGARGGELWRNRFDLLLKRSGNGHASAVK